MDSEKAEEIMDNAVETASNLIGENPQLAEMILKQLLRCNPEHDQGLHLLGLTKHRLGKHFEAIEIIQMAIEVNPDNPDNYNNIALAYGCVENFAKAIEHLEKALEIKSDHFLYLNNLALQYRNVGRYEESIKCFEKAVVLEDAPEIWTNFGGVYGEMKELNKSIECFDHAIELEPECSGAHVDRAYAYHLKGDWAKGFEEYEWRFKYFNQLNFYKEVYDQDKVWDGKETLEGKRILIYMEQGLGDTIQFVRYMKHLQQRGAHTILHVQPEIRSVIDRCEGVNETVVKNITKKVPGEEFPEYDLQCTSMSLPYLLQDFDISGKPYIKSYSVALARHLKARYKDTFNIGICWSGSPFHPNDARRSIMLKHFRPLYEMEGIKLFCLQVDKRKRVHKSGHITIDMTEGCEDMTRIVELTDLMDTFEDTVNILPGLDLVITCDTALMHLCGAMGLPAWGLLAYNPDWRWKTEGDSTPWYDSVKFFRQDLPNDWQGVMEEVCQELANKTAKEQLRTAPDENLLQD